MFPGVAAIIDFLNNLATILDPDGDVLVSTTRMVR
jgi:hypothetical protein